MKKIYFLISLVIILILLANVYYYTDIYKKQVAFQKNFLSKQTQVTGYEIDRYGDRFESDLNYIPFSEDLDLFFENKILQNAIITKLEFFYTKFENLVTNISLYDDQNNVYMLFRDRRNNFISDIYTTHSQRQLLNRHQIVQTNSEYFYHLPYFKNNVVVGNLVITIDYLKYIESVFEASYLKDIQWQWLIDMDGNVLFNNVASEDEFRITRIDEIVEGITNEDFNAEIQHKAYINGEEKDIISAYYPVYILYREFGIIFSTQSDIILRSIIQNSLIISILTIVLISLLIGMFIMYIKSQKREWNALKESEDALNNIIETLPIGIIVVDENHNIKKVNEAARELFAGEHEVQEGYKLNDWFFSKEDVQTEGVGEQYYLNNIISYKHENLEYALLREEIPLVIKGEKLFMQALVDITDIEKARKQKAIAVKTKSEFLANMSHEIRTPLNGIIGLTDSIDRKNLTRKQKEFVSSIKKSADLLLSIVDDILTFSKIEAGEMMLEEIPFNLREEIEHATKFLASKAREKKIDFKLEIADEVPEKQIGDPFKMRQIISHLCDNAIKFTGKGAVKVSISLVDNTAGKLILKFVIEDTGIGIPKDKIMHIFDSFTRYDSSRSHKLEGTGLGTTLSKEMIELLKGEIKVESPSGMSSKPECPGTRFTYTIESFSDERVPKNIPTEKITSYAHINVLIVKDNDDLGQNIGEVMRNFGVHIKTNFIQDKTINLIESNLESGKDRYHVLILRDSATFDAFKLAQELYDRKLCEKFLIILTSSNDRKGNYVRSKKLGIDYYLIEPCDHSELFNILQDNFPNIKLSVKGGLLVSKLRKDIHILVAEDNLINQKVAQTFFKNLGYEIDIAENGKQVIEMTNNKDYDIVFMDVMMPELDGWDATRAIRENGKTMPIIAITADVSEEAKDRAKAEGMNDYIPKPVKIDEIKRVLLRWFSETS